MFNLSRTTDQLLDLCIYYTVQHFTYQYYLLVLDFLLTIPVGLLYSANPIPFNQ